MSTYDFSAAFATSFSSIGGAGDVYTLLDLLKLYLGIDPADDTKDEELTRALNFAGDAVETYLDRVVAKRAIDEYFPHHFGTVVLHNLPTDVAQPITVNLDGVEQTDFKPYLTRGQLCFLSRQGMRPDMPMDWRSFQQVTVTYTAGFDPIPSDLAYAIVVVAGNYYTAEGTGSTPGGASGDVKTMTIYDVGSVGYDTGSSSGGGTIDYQAGFIPDNVAQTLTPYRRVSV